VKGLPGRTGAVTAVALSRSSRDFSERDRSLMNILRPYLNQTYANAVAFGTVRERLALVEAGLDALEQGVVLLTASGSVAQITPRARERLRTYFGAQRGSALPDALQR